MKKILLALLILFSLFDAAGAAPFQAVTDSQGVLTGYKDLADGRFIGLDPGHRHYQRVQDWISGGNTLLPADPKPPPPTDAERIDAAFPQTDTARVIFEALFELTNRTIALEGGTAVTRTQLRDWLKAKLPN